MRRIPARSGADPVMEARASPAWLADALRRINDHPTLRLGEPLPWNWKTRPATLVA
jgi:hypothetical protein